MNCILGAKYKRHSSLTVPLLRRTKIVSNLDLIVAGTDRLLTKWRHSPFEFIHTEIIENCENLILDIFGSIAFDFDLKKLESSSTHEFPQALHDFLSTYKIITYLPKVMTKLCLRLYPRHQRAKKTIEKYLYQAIDQELAYSQDSIGQRKKICFIACLKEEKRLSRKFYF